MGRALRHEFNGLIMHLMDLARGDLNYYVQGCDPPSPSGATSIHATMFAIPGREIRLMASIKGKFRHLDGDEVFGIPDTDKKRLCSYQWEICHPLTAVEALARVADPLIGTIFHTNPGLAEEAIDIPRLNDEA